MAPLEARTLFDVRDSMSDLGVADAVVIDWALAVSAAIWALTLSAAISLRYRLLLHSLTLYRPPHRQRKAARASESTSRPARRPWQLLARV